MFKVLIVVSVILWQCRLSVNLPIISARNSPVTPPEVLKFMRRFGYLESSSSSASEALYHEDAVIAAIKNVQKYGALNETGILDNETLGLMTSPRCGVSDMTRQSNRSKRFIIGSHGWQKRRITYFIANWSPKVGEALVAAGMKNAFNLWSKYSNLRFVRVYDPDADIIVAFGSGYHGDSFPFDGPGSVLAHAFYPYELNRFGGDIHFDDDENWRENATNLSEGVDFQSVAIHELGHSLGLAHSPIFASIMFPYYKGPQESRQLNYDDILAMYELYIRNAVFDEGIETTQKTTTLESISSESEESAETTSRKPLVRDPVEDQTEAITSRSSTFDGDFETVEKHKRRFSFVTIAPSTTPLTPSQTPNICEGIGFDAVGLLRGEVFIFRGEFVWRLNERYRIMSGYPIKFREIFSQLPPEVDHIDAIYERPIDEAIVLFSKDLYWIFDGSQFIEDSPRPISDFGLTNATKIDAAMVWSKNRRTYLFAGSQFVRYNEESKRIDDNYPAQIVDKWRGIPNNIDAAASVANGKTYFFKGNLYWLYDNRFIRPERGYPRRASTVWLGCPLQMQRNIRRQRNEQI